MNNNALRASGGIRQDNKSNQNSFRKRNQPNQQQRQQWQQPQQQQQQPSQGHLFQKYRPKQKRYRTHAPVKYGPAFLLPYNQEWPLIEKFHNKLILEEIESVLRERICDQNMLAKTKKLRKKYKDATQDEINRILKEIAVKKGTKQETVEEFTASLNDESKVQSLSKYFLFGINAVTKHLEGHGQLALLLVCRSAQPSLMTQHLLCQSLVADIPACAITDLSAISKLLALKSTLAFGFKIIESNPFHDLIDFIKDKIPTNDASPWVNLWKRRKDEEIEQKINEINSKTQEENEIKFEPNEQCTIMTKHGDPSETKQTASVNSTRKRKRSSDVQLLELNLQWKNVNRKTKK